MKNKKYIIIGVIVVLLLAGVGFLVYYYKNTNDLTIGEKNFLDDAKNTSKVININVLNNASIFGNNGEGIFYDFIDDFNSKYDLELNKETYNFGKATSGVSFGAKTTLGKDDILFYTDHYVLVSRTREIINDSSNLNGKNIGTLTSDISYVSNLINVGNINYSSYDTVDELFNFVNEGGYAIVPLHLYLEKILTNDLNIIYHFSDINMYYVMMPEKDDISSILSKYYVTWKENFETYYNKYLFNLLCKSLALSETEIVAMQSMNYNYGFVNNSPYEIISNSNYGGVIAVYLKRFTDFADLDFKFTRYKTYAKFNKAINNNEVDLYFGYYDTDNKLNKTTSGIKMNYVVVANYANPIVINSLNSLAGKEVYVEKNSVFAKYLSLVKDVKIKTYDNAKSLLKLNKKDAIIFMDSNIFEYYSHNGLKNYSVRYDSYINDEYTFSSKNSTAMYKLLNKYLDITDSKTIINEGIYNHAKTIKTGVVFGYIAKYFIYILCIGLVVGYFVLRKTRKVTIAKKINKADTLKFIDQLTLLKNRNYLNENIDKWNNNTIYPQTILAIDLNHVQSINDIEGYEEGDRQIKAAANILMKTQLDNSDIIRTDGNEFVVYLVGYSQKQITNYIHKLNKEFKKLPYNYGAEFGYSMIIDDIKTIEDALNEATKSLKEQKGNNEKKD